MVFSLGRSKFFRSVTPIICTRCSLACRVTELWPRRAFVEGRTSNAHVCESNPPEHAILILNDDLIQAFYNLDSDGVLAVGPSLIKVHTILILLSP